MAYVLRYEYAVLKFYFLSVYVLVLEKTRAHLILKKIHVKLVFELLALQFLLLPS